MYAKGILQEKDIIRKNNMFTLNPSYYGSVFVTPKIIVEKYIKMASFCALKSLLWILNNQGGNFSVEEIAKAVGSSQADTKEAVEYWISEGILIKNGDSSPVPSPTVSDSHLKNEEVKSENKSATEVKEKPSAPEIKLVRPTYEQVSQRIAEDDNIAGLLNQAQIMLGKSLGFNNQSAFIQMYDDYGLSVEVILTLIQYCINIGKKSTAYMLSTAKIFYEKDIDTLEKANEFIDRNKKIMKIYEEFCQFTGISAPTPTPKQTDYFLNWDDMGLSVEMMVLAYNETIDRKGKINFNYTNKILENWHENGYKTPDDVKNAREAYKKQKQGTSERSYDINKAVEQATSGELVYKKKKRDDK